MRSIVTAIAMAAVWSLQGGIVVDAQTDIPRRITSQQMTFDWDWDAEWIPDTAQQATLTVKKRVGGDTLLSRTVGRTASPSVTWEIGDLLTTDGDTAVNVTLSFPDTDAQTVSRTVTYEVRQAVFAPHVRACETNSMAWRSCELPATFPYNANWFRGASNITFIQWRDLEDTSLPLIGPPEGQHPSTPYGFMTVPKDYLGKSVYLASIHEGDVRLAQCEITTESVKGTLLILR